MNAQEQGKLELVQAKLDDALDRIAEIHMAARVRCRQLEDAYRANLTKQTLVLFLEAQTNEALIRHVRQHGKA